MRRAVVDRLQRTYALVMGLAADRAAEVFHNDRHAGERSGGVRSLGSGSCEARVDDGIDLWIQRFGGIDRAVDQLAGGHVARSNQCSLGQRIERRGVCSG